MYRSLRLTRPERRAVCGIASSPSMWRSRENPSRDQSLLSRFLPPCGIYSIFSAAPSDRGRASPPPPSDGGAGNPFSGSPPARSCDASTRGPISLRSCRPRAASVAAVGRAWNGVKERRQRCSPRRQVALRGLPRKVMRPCVRSYGDTDTCTVSPGSTRMWLRFNRPDSWAMIVEPAVWMLYFPPPRASTT